MDTPNTPRPAPQSAAYEARTKALHELKIEMELLCARLEYMRLMLKLGVRVA